MSSSTPSLKNNPHRSTFEEMKKEGEWANILKNTSWPCHNILQVNSDWMSNRDTDGSGPILEKDYVKMMEEHGFKVHMSQTLTLEYILSREFIDNYFKTRVLTGFKSLQDDKRELFLTEYKRRMENKDTLKVVNYPMDVFQVLGQKVEEL
ncbi:uncharacterized protein LOC111717188 [Eurytemora carolleeae]|uniref:uncharacterized protein LOC111717188 n=1 Tax=Eurytemora carolleeae TaxID=1294199 RepID=UPI000C7863A1|nr:uncharacterized protein LOC111717188 [Eurytemora carolleeae]|eukprot:XP_023348463.1 uncharacterized protein LOC111717188 [Eurytemora affinis]